MIRASVIGAGWYAAQSHIPTLAAEAGVALDGVCRLGAEPLERVRGHFGFAFASEDHRDLLARKPDIVVVASPHHLHHAHAAAALDAGAHVLVEKPMTLDPAEAQDLVARARHAKRHLLVANGYHHLPRVAELRDWIAAGAVGRIEHASCGFVSATRAVFEGDEGLQRWSSTFFRPDRMTWQDPARGGGFVWGQMSHAVAALLWLTGLVPRSVSGLTFGGAVDLGCAAALACEGGAAASLSGAASMPEGERALLRIVVAGDQGVLDIDFDRERAELHRRDGANRLLEPARGTWTYDCVGPVRALVALARDGAAPNLSPGEIGAATVSVLAALKESAAQGGAIRAASTGDPAR